MSDTAGEPEATRKITECPECDYALVGLPDGRPCPECGATFEAGAEVFRGRTGRGLLHQAIAILLVLLAAGFTFKAALEAISNGTTQGEVLWLLFLLMLLSNAAWYAIRGRERRVRWYALLDARGVTYREGDEEVHFPGRDIWAAEYSPFSHGVRLMNADGKQIGYVPDLRQRHYAEIAALLRAIESRTRVWRGAVAETPAGDE